MASSSPFANVLVASLCAFIACFLSVSSAFAETAEATDAVEKVNAFKQSLFVVKIENKSLAPGEVQIGDRLISIDDRSISDVDELKKFVRESKGEYAELKVERNGMPVGVRVKLAKGKLKLTFAKPGRFILRGNPDANQPVPITKTSQSFSKLLNSKGSASADMMKSGELCFCKSGTIAYAFTDKGPELAPELAEPVCLAEGDRAGEVWWAGYWYLEPLHKHNCYPLFYLAAIGIFVSMISYASQGRKILLPALILIVAVAARLAADFLTFDPHNDTMIWLALSTVSIIGELVAVAFTLVWMVKARRAARDDQKS